MLCDCAAVFSSIGCPVAVPGELVRLGRGLSNYGPKMYSSKLIEVLSLSDKEKMLIAMRDLYLRYAEQAGVLSAECLASIGCGVILRDVEEKKYSYQYIKSEMKVLRERVRNLLEDYEGQNFPTNEPISMVSHLLRKGVISRK